ncbi:hypothetical protein BDY24DRAFT_442169 [Mrakia frigida]|uniref:uncharacterized protein n=1 Tax=Mrakia frigida TaxID=29902 RepID=UPI003FCBF4FF
MQFILSSEAGVLKSLPKSPHPSVPPSKDPRVSLFYLALVSLSIFLLVPLVSLLIARTKLFLRRRSSNSTGSSSLLDSDDYTLLGQEDDEQEPLLPAAPPPKPRILQANGGTFSSDLRDHVQIVAGSKVIFAFNLARFLGCLALLGLTVAAVVSDSERSSSAGLLGAGKEGLEVLKKKGKGRGREREEEKFGREEWVEIAQSVFFFYTSVLALLTLTIRKARFVGRQVKPHLAFLLFFAFSLSAYRNLYPLATFHGQPLDIAVHRGKRGDGWTSLVWWRVGILALVGVAVPLLVPRTYIPVDVKNPSANPAPEQTASVLSLVFFAYVTPLVLHAWKLPSLPFDDLPPLPDYDKALFLSKHLDELDPVLMPQGSADKSKRKRSRHLGWGMLQIFWKDAIVLALLLFGKLLSDFARPLAIQMLLGYIENPTDVEVRPIVWVASLFFGPLFGSLAVQLYQMNSSRILVRVEGLVSQLILNHSLRIRFVGKPQVASRGSSSTRTSGINTPTASASTPATNETEVASEEVTSPAKETKTQSGDIVGKINNLIGSDLQAIAQARDILIAVFFSPLQSLLSVLFLYRLVSWSSLVGLAAMLATFPLPTLLLKAVNQVQQDLTVATDARIQVITEAMSSIRMIKMLAWEAKIEERIYLAREEELRLVRKKVLLNIINNSINFIVSSVCMIATFASYALLQGQVMTPSKIFSTVAVFEILRWALHVMFYELGSVVRGKVSLDRLDAFLHQSEVIDEFDEDRVVPPHPKSSSFIGFSNATFAWLREEKADKDVRNFRLNLDVEFVPGEINLVSGPTGSGKSSVLAALLGEMHFEPKSFDSNFNLPRSGGIAFCPQEPWLMSSTVRENIILNLAYDSARFKSVVYACGLTRDLELLSGGDQTEVGEKGVTLSGGQKARITLARAVYSNAQIILMDDILSALDAHTAKWIVEKCLSSQLIKGRTVIIASHHTSLLTPVASFVLRLGRDGTVEAQGPVDKVIRENAAVEKQQKEDARLIDEEDDASEKPAPSKADVLIQEEEKPVGKVTWKAYREFVDGLGWRTLVIFLVTIFVQEIGKTAATWWLGAWGNEYEKHDAGDVSVVYWLGLYTVISLVTILIYSYGQASFFVGAVNASRALHVKLVESILNSTFRWLDATPVGRIIARFSKDMQALDGLFALFFSHVVEISAILIVKLTGIIIAVPIFAVPSLVLGLIGTALGELYIHVQMSVKVREMLPPLPVSPRLTRDSFLSQREMSNAKSPLFNHLNGAINGVVSIRAFGIQEWIGANTRTKVDKWSRTAISFYDLDRWITVSIDFLAGAFTAALAGHLLYSSRGNDAGNVGFLLNISVAFSSHILWWVRVGNMFMVEANSLERIVDYFPIPHEPSFDASRTPPASWPTSGSIVVEDLTARYSETGSPVLKGLSFSVRSGEKIGVVGRTGAGKSSLALALLRLVPTEGKVIIDGIDSNQLNLSTLRNTITIIPQDPILLSGTLRFNLDPAEEIDDAALNDALNASGLSSLQAGADMESAQTISLDTILSSGGSNLSQGQRQVLVLARALVRRSLIVIMDEATSSVDHETDEVIQRGIRRELSGVTVLTIAHRLRSICDYDRLICLSEGKIVAFDTPKALLLDPTSYFSMLVKSSGEEDALREMVLGQLD